MSVSKVLKGDICTELLFWQRNNKDEKSGENIFPNQTYSAQVSIWSNRWGYWEKNLPDEEARTDGIY